MSQSDRTPSAASSRTGRHEQRWWRRWFVASDERTAATDRELRAWVWSFLICYAAGLLGAFGWGRHWNAYVCLLLTLGSVVLWATFVTAWKNRLGR